MIPVTGDMTDEEVKAAVAKAKDGPLLHGPLLHEGNAIRVREPARPDPLALVQAAIDKGMDPHHILDFVDRIKRTEAAEAFAAAIARFQAECPRVLKERVVKNRDGKPMYNFASYDDIKRAVTPLQIGCGIVTSFTAPRMENGLLTGTIRVRVGSHVEETSLPIAVPQGMNTNKAQDMVAASTYLRRILFCMALDIVTTDDDNDGRELGDYVTPLQVDTLRTLIDKTGTKEEHFLKWAGADSLEHVSQVKFDEAVNTLGKKVKA